MEASVKNHISDSLKWLLTSGFKQVSHNEDLVFENRHISISISFFKSVKDCSLLISIKKAGENKSFFLNEFLEHIGKEKITFNSSKNIDQFIERNLNCLKSLFENELNEVVNGRIWIDVPRDYLGYR